MKITAITFSLGFKVNYTKCAFKHGAYHMGGFNTVTEQCLVAYSTWPNLQNIYLSATCRYNCLPNQDRPAAAESQLFLQ